jgi:hypothetical protein
VCGPRLAFGGEWSQYQNPTETIWGSWTIVSVDGDTQANWVGHFLGIIPPRTAAYGVTSNSLHVASSGWRFLGPSGNINRHISVPQGSGFGSDTVIIDGSTITLKNYLARTAHGYTLNSEAIGTHDGLTLTLSYEWFASGRWQPAIEIVLEKYADWHANLTLSA